MSRRRRKSEASVSLFPFLSILACVIGVLTLMITAMALGQMQPSEVQEAEEEAKEAKQRYEKYKEVQGRIAKNQKELEKLQKLLDNAEAIRKQLADARKELEELENQTTDDDSKQNIKMLAESKRLRERIEELKTELPELNNTIDDLKKQLAERKKPPEEAQVKVQPSGSGYKLKPTFVECVPGSVVIFENNQEIRVRYGDLAESKEFAAMLNRVKNQEDATLIFLVREDGVGTYQHARNIARSRYVQTGKLPVLGQGRLDLSLFDKQNKKQ